MNEKEQDALIVDAKVSKISDLWKRKPKGLSFSDTDAIVITAKTASGQIIKKTLYGCIKPDGTFSTNPLSKGEQGRQRRIASFIKHYITKNIKDYDVREGIKKWKGKTVKVIIYKGGGYIHTP